MRINVKFRKFEVEFDAEQITNIRYGDNWHNIEPNNPVDRHSLFAANRIVYQSVLGVGTTRHMLNIDRAERVSVTKET